MPGQRARGNLHFYSMVGGGTLPPTGPDKVGALKTGGWEAESIIKCQESIIETYFLNMTRNVVRNVDLD